jgi:hypothetical protein
MTLTEMSRSKGMILVSQASGCLVLSIAATIVISWYAHFTLVLRAFPGVPMVYNTAFGFILAGLGLIAAAGRQ